MEIPFITTISLIWFIYVTLATEADRQISDLFNRLKFSLSVTPNEEISTEQLNTISSLGISEVFSYKKILENSDLRAKNISKFESFYRNIERYKNCLILNAFLLTFFSILCLQINNNLNFFILGHISWSFAFSILFYKQASKAKEINFIGFKLDSLGN